MRSDVILWMTEATSDSARLEVARLPGAMSVEATRDVPVRFTNGHSSERSTIQGFAALPKLRRIIDTSGREAALPEDGLVMTDRLALKLGVRVGEQVRPVPVDEVDDSRADAFELAQKFLLVPGYAAASKPALSSPRMNAPTRGPPWSNLSSCSRPIVHPRARRAL